MNNTMVMLVGSVACGKTTLCQRLNDMALTYHKTQTVQIVKNTIDTPGEYLENRRLQHALIVTSADADMLLFLQDARETVSWFSPGQASMFAVPVVGVVTKTDLATAGEIAVAEEFLRQAGVEKIFTTSAITGNGIKALMEYIQGRGQKRCVLTKS